jgi:hypothetical protein
MRAPPAAARRGRSLRAPYAWLRAVVPRPRPGGTIRLSNLPVKAPPLITQEPAKATMMRSLQHCNGCNTAFVEAYWGMPAQQHAWEGCARCRQPLQLPGSQVYAQQQRCRCQHLRKATGPGQGTSGWLPSCSTCVYAHAFWSGSQHIIHTYFVQPQTLPSKDQHMRPVQNPVPRTLYNAKACG